MKEKLRSVLLFLLAALMLFGFALAVPSGRVTDEADARYRELQRENDEDNWLLQYHLD